MFTAFLIKYAEIGVKGKNRYLFEEALVKQIRYALKRCEGEFSVTRTPGRIYVEAASDFDYDETIDNLKTVFGISGICPMVHVEDEGFEKLGEAVVKYMDDVYPDKHFSFKVQARRARKNYPLNSMELNVELGAVILDAFPELTVDVHKPDVMLNVEIREKIGQGRRHRVCVPQGCRPARHQERTDLQRERPGSGLARGRHREAPGQCDFPADA